MSDISAALSQLQHLCTDIRNWIDDVLPTALFRAPIIDWHHPDDYAQKGITGLRKFLGTAEAERDHVAGILSSPVRPKNFSSNAPHLLAVWHEFIRADIPLGGISQTLDVGSRATIKIDIISQGGAEWIKVNTIKEARLLAEFREQDSYVNSDYDSDTSSPGAGPSNRPSAAFTNSLIAQGQALLAAAETYPRSSGAPPPKVRMILSRLVRPSNGFSDDRIDRTITHLQSLGIIVQLGPSSSPPIVPSLPGPVQPTRNIVLDLSILIALCCDSTHIPLPASPQELEGRFRARRRNSTTRELELAEHSRTSKDLRDQLRWETEHPLIQEMKDRLGDIGGDLAFWITEEVRDRMPGLVDVIGGPEERRRGRALLEGDGSFWQGSRWEGNEGVLRGLRVGILSEPATAESTSTFQLALPSSCRNFIRLIDAHSAPSSSPPSPSPSPEPKSQAQRKSRSLRKPVTAYTANRFPSAHTLRTLLAGADRGWTVLTNNRGAVGKVIREMGVTDGLIGGGGGDTPGSGHAEDLRAAIWVVNPSSLSEWRRLEVVQENAKTGR